MRKPIVLDIGTGAVKAGFAGEKVPRAVFPSVIGSSKLGAGPARECIGEEAEHKRGILSLKYPIEEGLIHNWEDVEKILRYTLIDTLRVDPQQHAILIADPDLNPSQNRENLSKILKEVFKIPEVYFASQSELALRSSGCTSGIVLDSGDEVTRIVPIYQGHVIKTSIKRLPLAGRTLTEHLIQLLTEKGYYFSTSSEKEIVRDMKEKYCYVTNNFEEEIVLNKVYILPDGQKVSIDHEAFCCPEALFNPSLIGLDVESFPEAIYNTIETSETEMKKALCSHIVLTGGNTLFPGFESRLRQELQLLIPPGLKLALFSPPDRKYSVWKGGSILAQQL